MDFDRLSRKFDREAVHWRVQGQPYERGGKFAAMALAYIDARDVMDRLDEVCGPDGWQDSYTETSSGRVICTLSIRIGEEWVAKSDGAGGTAVEAEKGGLSDALKRAAVKWGIGRYLYRLDSPWVACEVRRDRDGKPKLNNGKAQWKAWTEDPWNKVRMVPYHAAAQPPAKDPAPKEEQAEPSFQHRERTDEILGWIEGCKTQQHLRDVWTRNAATLKRIEADKPAMFAELVTAKDKAKARLTDDPARQAPPMDEGRAA